MPRMDVVAGSGPTAVFAAAAGLLSEGPRLLVSYSRHGMLSPIRSFYPHLPFNNTLVPIFPPSTKTELSQLLARLRIRLDDFDRSSDGCREVVRRYKFDHVSPCVVEGSLPFSDADSFGHYAATNGWRTLTLASKQYGRELLSRPLSLVRAKVDNSYLRANASEFHRLGYVGGRSRYAIAMEILLRSLTTNNSSIREINPSDRSVVLATGQRLMYKRLIFTGRITQLADLLGVRPYSPLSAPAHFCVGRCDKGEPNQITYDLRDDSPVFRVITTDTRIWVAQLSQDYAIREKQSQVPEDSLGADLKAALADLLETGSIEILAGLLTLNGAYPLERLPIEYEQELESRCQDAGVVRFGRFAEWRYVDLHELDWSRIV